VIFRPLITGRSSTTNVRMTPPPGACWPWSSRCRTDGFEQGSLHVCFDQLGVEAARPTCGCGKAPTFPDLPIALDANFTIFGPGGLGAARAPVDLAGADAEIATIRRLNHSPTTTKQVAVKPKEMVLFSPSLRSNGGSLRQAESHCPRGKSRD